MSALVYFLIWAVLIFLMMRFGCGAQVMGGGHGTHRKAGGSDRNRGLRWAAPDTDRDPVCGKTVRTDTAKPTVHDGMVYYFCSRDCREAFEVAPELYTGEGAGSPKRLEGSNV